MKFNPPLLAALSAVVCPFHLNGEQAELPAARAFIAGTLEVPEFTPPVPVPPKQVPVMRIDATTTVPCSNGKTLTIIRGEASTLPDIPPPPEPRPLIKRERTAEEIAREIYRRRHSLSFGATVYDHRVSVIRWQHPDTGDAYEAVCGFDIGLLAGVGRFVRAGENYDVMLMHSLIDMNRARNPAWPRFPDLSGVPENSIRFVKGDPGDAVGTAAIQLVKELIANEKVRLQLFQAGRARHQAARAAWEKANPVPPRDETIWIRPHRGSRYLAEPKPEAAAR